MIGRQMLFGKAYAWIKSRFRLLVLGLALLLACVQLFVCCASFKQWRYLPANADDVVTVYVVSHGWHTGIVIPADNLGQELAFLKDVFGKTAYYEIGWGEADFYQSEGVTVGLALKAMFWINLTVVHVVSVPVSPAHSFPKSKVVGVRLSREGFSRLQQSLAASFRRPVGGKPVVLRKGLYDTSYFYSGEGHYYMTNTCNTWTARMLDSAGVPMRTLMTLSAGSVISQAEEAVEALSEL